MCLFGWHRFHGEHFSDGIERQRRERVWIRNCCLRTLPAGLVDRTTHSLGFLEGASDGMIRVGFALVGGASITIDMSAALTQIATEDE